MKTQTIRLLVAGALGIAFVGAPPALAQTTLGGAKTQQNKIGGVAKPAPVVGGAVIHTPPPPPPPKPMVNTFKPAAPGVVTPNATTSAALGQPPGPRPNSAGHAAEAGRHLEPEMREWRLHLAGREAVRPSPQIAICRPISTTWSFGRLKKSLTWTALRSITAKNFSCHAGRPVCPRGRSRFHARHNR